MTDEIDRGLQRERTQLAWRRTHLLQVGVAALGVRVVDPARLGWNLAVATVLGIVVAVSHRTTGRLLVTTTIVGALALSAVVSPGRA